MYSLLQPSWDDEVKSMQSLNCFLVIRQQTFLKVKWKLKCLNVYESYEWCQRNVLKNVSRYVKQEKQLFAWGRLHGLLLYTLEKLENTWIPGLSHIIEQENLGSSQRVYSLVFLVEMVLFCFLGKLVGFFVGFFFLLFLFFGFGVFLRS